MVSQPLLTGTAPTPTDLVRRHLEQLVGLRLAGRQIDGVTFVEELLALATQVGTISCSPVADRGLRFEWDGGSVEVDLDGNRGKLRMLCARLSVLCNEGGAVPDLYGGEGTIRRTADANGLESKGEPIRYHLAWKARWTNTPGKHEFTISVGR